MVVDFECRGAEATAEAGRLLGRLLRAGDTVGLIGDLGAGKTLLVQGIAVGLKIPPETRVTSPTFTLVNEYRGGALILHHADLYRIERESELAEVGLRELMGGPGVVAVEWSDRFAVLPPDSLQIQITVMGDDLRSLSASGGGPRSRQLAADWGATLPLARSPAPGE
jgi:tRNA threonylcarbamoyladenosine biosynthesis protein TsaE